MRQKDLKDGMLGSLSRSRTEHASRWQVRSVKPEVGQENLSPGHWLFLLLSSEQSDPTCPASRNATKCSSRRRESVEQQAPRHAKSRRDGRCCCRQPHATPLEYSERLKNGRLENGEGLADHAQLRIALADLFFCRVNLSVDLIPRRSPNETCGVPRCAVPIHRHLDRLVPAWPNCTHRM